MTKAAKTGRRKMPRLPKVQNQERFPVIDLIQQRRPKIDALCRKFHVRQLELFGSAADAGRFDPAHSDVDFLVAFTPEAEPRLAELYLDLIAALRELLGREVDVVMTRAIRSPYFRQVVDRSRRTLYAARPAA